MYWDYIISKKVLVGLKEKLQITAEDIPIIITFQECIFGGNKINHSTVKYRYTLLIVFLVIFMDQAVKYYVKTHFYYGEEVNVIGNWFKLHFIENEGMAYGLKLSQAETGKLILTLFRLIAVVFGFYFLKKMCDKGYGKGALVCGSLILAGAFGNLIDSLFYGLIFTESSFHLAQLVPFGQGYGKLFHGKVVDMLYFPLVDMRLPQWVPFKGGEHFIFFEPIFNIADAAISIGVLSFLFFQKRLLQLPLRSIQPETKL